MMTQPKCSIIVTTYNIEGYIDACLSDIEKQTLAPVEVIIVDDGSTDGTRDIIDRYVAANTHFKKIYLTENSIGGVATPANAGIDAATGDYIGFADGDDRYHPEMFEKLYNAAGAADTDLAMCDYDIIHDGCDECSRPADHMRWAAYLEPCTLTFDTETRKAFLRFISVPWRKIYRRSMIEANAIRFPVGDYFYEDNPFHWLTTLSANGCALVPEQLCQHRIGRSGQTMATVSPDLYKIFDHHETIRGYLAERGLNEIYRDDLLEWVMDQSGWTGARVTPELRPVLFQALRECYSHYSLLSIKRLAKRNNPPVYVGWMAVGAVRNDEAFFLKAVGGLPRTILDWVKFGWLCYPFWDFISGRLLFELWKSKRE